jgi:regulator of nucleoside diphosphate kinase
MHARQTLRTVAADAATPERAGLPAPDALQPSEPGLLSECWLTSRDFALLEQHLIDVERRSDSSAVLLGRMIRRKLAGARVVLPDDIPPDVVTGNSRVVFSIDGRLDEFRRLVHWSHEVIVGQTLLVPTPLGVTLLGMKAGQRAALPRVDGTARQVELRAIAYQPERERRAADVRGETAEVAP